MAANSNSSTAPGGIPAMAMEVGQRVSIPKSGEGEVAFVGNTSFAQGKWVGIVLDEPLGKNDGIVQGTRYFDATPNHGVFVRPSQVRVLDESSTSDTSVSSPAPKPVVPSSGVKRNSSAPGTGTPPAVRSTSSAAATGLKTPSRTGLATRSAVSTAARPSTVATGTRTANTIGTPRPTASRSSSAASASSSAAAAAGPRSSLAHPVSKPAPIQSALKRAATQASSRNAAVNSESMPPPPVPRATPARRPSSVVHHPASSASRVARPGSTAMSRGPSSSSASALARPTSAASTHSQASARSSGRTSNLVSPSQRPTQSKAPASPDLDQGGVEAEEEEASLLDEEDPEEFDPPPPSSQPTDDPFSLRTRGKTTHTASQQAMETVPLRTYEELSTKHKILEARHAETRIRLTEMQGMKEEHASLLAARPKFQSKILELSEQVNELKTALKEAELSKDSMEDMQSRLELLSVDKEMTEEQLEQTNMQLDELKERMAEQAVETQVLKEALATWEARVEGSSSADAEQQQHDGQEDGQRSSVQGTNLKVLQLERQNDRLKEALMRLRDLTAESDAEHRRRVTDLEKELDLTRDLQDEYDVLQERAETSEAQVEHLKAQLDDALGAEDILDQLTERNLSLSEQLEEMRATVEDLEAIKELNDELEENHVETEAQLLEELEMKDQAIQEHRKRCDLLEESIVDYEGTIGQFRELVTSLQSDLTTLREQQHTAESDAQNLTSQTQTMLNLNLKLQSTVNKGQVKTIELDLRKMEAAQAVERLNITRPYLPAQFFEADSDAIDALMFFDRLSRKAELIGKTLSERHSIAESLTSTVPDGLVVVCEARGKLARFSILTRRFAANLRRCSPDIFVRMGSAYKEIAPIEKRVDAFVEQLRAETLREGECSKELDKFIAQAGHMAEVNLGESGLDLGEMQSGQAQTVDLDLDTFISGVGYTKQCLAVICKEPDVRFEPQDLSMQDHVFEPFQRLIDQARQAQSSARKLHRRMDELLQNSSSLSPEAADPLIELSRTAHHLATSGVRMSDLINRYLSEVRATRQPLQLVTITGILQEASAELDFKTPNVLVALDTEVALTVSRLSSSLTAALNPDAALQVNFIPPWSERVAELATAAAVNVEAEQRVVRLNEELRDLARELRNKDQALQESGVKIELMDKKLGTAKKHADQVSDLESELSKSKKDGKTFEQTIEELQKELEALEQENVKLKGAAAATASAPSSHAKTNGQAMLPSGSHTGSTAAEEALAFTGSLETAQLLSYIESLRATLRFLRQENAFLKSQDLMREFDASAFSQPAPSSGSASEVARQRSEATKALWKDTLKLASMPQVVDLTGGSTGSSSSSHSSKWTRQAKKPEVQYERQKAAVSKLSHRFKNLEMPSVVRIQS